MKGDFHRRVARKKPFLNVETKRNRLQYALEHKHWTIDDWSQLIWTDESYVCLNGRGGRVYITRTPYEEYH